RVVVAVLRLGEWLLSLIKGQPTTDSAATRLALGMFLWLTGIWAGWQFRRNHFALRALLPGGVMLALALDYTREDTELLVMYLVISLVLIVLANYRDVLAGWIQRSVDYAESIAIDSAMLAIPVIIVLVGTATLSPSLSWQDLRDKFRESNHRNDGRETESAEHNSQPNVANNDEYRSGGLPRMLLISNPPEQLQNVVMTVSMVEDPSEIKRYYWRARTYDIYTGVGWTSRPATETTLVAGTALLEPTSSYQVLHQYIELTPDRSKNVYWTGLLVQADTDLKIAWRLPPPSNPDPSSNGDMLGALATTNKYTIESYIPHASVEKLQAAGRNYPPEIAARYLDLPDSIPKRVLTLASEITGTERTPYDQAIAIESYLRTIPYSLEVEAPPFGTDIVDYFLFTLQRGYCDYYASAMVVMARATGTPARIVVGYASGNYDPSAGQFIVRERHAHTWVEVYFPEIGWVEFEPTASQTAAIDSDDRDEAQSDMDQSLDNVDTFRFKAQWLAFISTLGGQTLFAGLGLIILILLWQGGSMIYLHLLPVPLAIHRIYMHIDKTATHLLPNLSRGRTPLNIQVALSKKLRESKHNVLTRIAFEKAPLELEQLTLLYTTQTFSQHPLSRKQVKKGIRTWSRLRWRLWIARVAHSIRSVKYK
ncbi:MAG: transglutaminase domain-containing protein, partial [Anaerolineales bacterium]